MDHEHKLFADLVLLIICLISFISCLETTNTNVTAGRTELYEIVVLKEKLLEN